MEPANRLIYQLLAGTPIAYKNDYSILLHEDRRWKILRVLSLLRVFIVTSTYDFAAYIAFDRDFFCPETRAIS